MVRSTLWHWMFRRAGQRAPSRSAKRGLLLTARGQRQHHDAARPAAVARAELRRGAGEQTSLRGR